MRKIIPELTTELERHFGDPKDVGAGKPFRVNTYRELVEHTAKLSYKNKDHLLFFRGQGKDYKNKAGNSTFYPSIYRGDYTPVRELEIRFDILEGCSRRLSQLFEDQRIEGHRDLKRRRSIQWSILQHYEVCSTPYTDFTHSLRVACSFATMDNNGDEAYIFVFGLPYVTNRISVNSEHDIINIRLLSICPPTALRPYFQEGYLAGTDDVTTNFDSKTELDFSNRLVAKFIIPNTKSFWGSGFDEIPKESLYPDKDPIAEVCSIIKADAKRGLRKGDLGEFIQSWGDLERELTRRAKRKDLRSVTVREAARELFYSESIPEQTFHLLERLRLFRNKLVHAPNKLKEGEVATNLDLLDEAKKTLKIKS